MSTSYKIKETLLTVVPKSARQRKKSVEPKSMLADVILTNVLMLRGPGLVSHGWSSARCVNQS